MILELGLLASAGALLLGLRVAWVHRPATGGPLIPWDDPRQLTPHFALEEFASGDKAPFPAEAVRNLVPLAQALEKIRARFGKPITIHSGYRSPAHNRAVGGALLSQHPQGRAADISIQGVTPQQIADYAATLPEIGGIGVYSTFCHVDTRPRGLRGAIARWVG